MRDTLILLFVYLIPLMMLSYMTIEILLRNPKRVEYRLLSLYFGGYALLFLEEYVRQISPIEYSPTLVTYWFGNIGLLIPCLFLHYLAKMSNFDRKLPKWLTPYIFYTPLLPVLFTIVFQQNVMNSQNFVQIGLYKYPEFNISYITTLTAANIFHSLIIIITIYVHKKVKVPEQKKLVSLLIFVGTVVLLWDIIFGYFSFREVIPPYPYIFGGIIWSMALSYAMYKFDFLSSFNKRYQTLYNLNPAAIVLVDSNGMIKDANPAAKQLFQTEIITKQPFSNFIASKNRNHWKQSFNTFLEKNEKFTSYETTVISNQLDERYAIIEGDYIYIDNEVHNILIIRDIHERKQAEERIRFLAYHDSLTKLANRIYLYEVINQAFTKNEPFAVIIIDLDGFKPINDTYGHHVGDMFLIHLAQILDKYVDNLGVAARIGGDEFCLFVHYKDRQTLEQHIQQLFLTFKTQPLIWQEHHLHIQASIGASIYPEHGDSVDTLIKRADEAMYTIKNNGKNSYAIYEDSQVSS